MSWSRTPASATAAWAVWPPAIWTPWPPAATRPPATPSCTNSASSSRRSSTAGRPSCPTTGCPAARSGSTRMPEHAVDVHFGGRIEEFWDDGYHHVAAQGLHHRQGRALRHVRLRLRRQGRQPAAACGRPRAPAIDMEAFNRGDYISAFGQSSMAEAISKVLYPNDNHTARARTLRLRQQYFLVRGLHRGHRPPPHGRSTAPWKTLPRKTPSTSTTPTRRWPSPS